MQFLCYILRIVCIFSRFAVTDVPTTLPPPTTTKLDQGKEKFNGNIKNNFLQTSQCTPCELFCQNELPDSGGSRRQGGRATMVMWKWV